MEIGQRKGNFFVNGIKLFDQLNRDDNRLAIRCAICHENIHVTYLVLRSVLVKIFENIILTFARVLLSVSSLSVVSVSDVFAVSTSV
jgi:hypothetical protein